MNYGAGGAPAATTSPSPSRADNAKVTFSYDGATHVLTIRAPATAHDNNVEWDGLRHDSRDTLYRTPGGAVAGRHAGDPSLPHLPRRRHRRARRASSASTGGAAARRR